LSKCNECGKDLTFLNEILDMGKTNLCPACKQIKNAKIQEFNVTLEKAGKDNYLSPDELEALDKLYVSMKLNQEDIRLSLKYFNKLCDLTRTANYANFEKTFENFSIDNSLSDEEFSDLEKFIIDFNLTESNISSFNDYLDLKFLNRLEKGQLPEAKTDLLLKKDEICHYQTFCSLVEERQDVRYVGGYSGVSLKIFKGVYYKIGATRGKRLVETSNEISDTGSLYITNKRVIFTGSEKNVTYKLENIVDLKLFDDAVSFVTENQDKMKYFTFGDRYAVEVIAKLISMLNT